MAQKAPPSKDEDSENSYIQAHVYSDSESGDEQLRVNQDMSDHEDEVQEISQNEKHIQEAKAFTLRAYQLEIFKNAKDRNSIIYLETGTGKTVISIMLMNYYLKKFEFKKKVPF